jgi:hypothetical protein
MWEWPKITALAAGKRRRIQTPLRRAGVVRDREPDAVAVELELRGQRTPAARQVGVGDDRDQHARTVGVPAWMRAAAVKGLR